MKTIALVRHAKSSWSDPLLTDHDRPLNKRGIKDGPRMAAFVKNDFANFDLLMSSSAKRAMLTSDYFREVYPTSRYEIEPRLYHCSSDDIINILRKLDDTVDSVLLFGHNPGFTYFMNNVPRVTIDNVPTCGYGRFIADIDTWKDTDFNKMKLSTFQYPKGL